MEYLVNSEIAMLLFLLMRQSPNMAELPVVKLLSTQIS